MSESVAEQALAAIDARLSAIVGDDGITRWLTVDKCARVDNWAAWEPDWFARSPEEAKTIYLIKSGSSEILEHVSGSIDATLQVFIVCGTRYGPTNNLGQPTVDPIDQKEAGITHSQTLQSRMEQDVRAALYADISLGVSGVINTEIVAVERMLPFVDGWAMLILEGRVTYNERVL